MIAFIRRHPLGVGTGTVLVVAALAWLAFGFFGVHTLFIDDVVEESAPVFDAAPVALETEAPLPTDAPAATPTTVAQATADQEATNTAPSVPTTAPIPEPTPVPTTEAPATAPATTAPPVAEIVTEYSGVFESDAHPTAGDAVVLGNGTGQRFLRFENFETDNGPDLNVYLVNSSTGDVSDFIDLGDLTGNIGDQNYEIPEGVDLGVYDQVVIWCVRFGVGFGDALLTPA